MLFTRFLFVFHLVFVYAISAHPSQIETPIFKRGFLGSAGDNHKHSLNKRTEGELLGDIGRAAQGGFQGKNPKISSELEAPSVIHEGGSHSSGEKLRATSFQRPLEDPTVFAPPKENLYFEEQERQPSNLDASNIFDEHDKPRGSGAGPEEPKGTQASDSEDEKIYKENSGGGGPPSSPRKPSGFNLDHLREERAVFLNLRSIEESKSSPFLLKVKSTWSHIHKFVSKIWNYSLSIISRRKPNAAAPGKLMNSLFSHAAPLHPKEPFRQRLARTAEEVSLNGFKPRKVQIDPIVTFT